MRKSVLLFFLLLVAIFLWKVSEVAEENQWNETAVDELVTESNDGKIAKN
ncbi:MAG: hypothetical protein HRT65_06205 [Flavobacteriaceae bacterium]|nr:hypothetical protein [Flavobacteriaceae bacterium]